MALVLQTNVASLDAQKNLASTQHSLQTNFQRLSSGYRINSAADDASGLAISESLRSQVGSFTVAERNANNAISMAQTAEGSLGQISGIMGRMRELAVQGSNGDLGTTDRDYLQTEFSALADEIDRIASSSKYNGKDLLAGAATDITFQVGINNSASDQIKVSFGGVSLTDLKLDKTSVDGADSTNSLAAIDAVDAAQTSVSTMRASYGAAMNRLQTTVSNIQTFRSNLSAANSRIRDADVAEEAAQMSRNQVLQQAGAAVLAQANQSPQVALKLLG
jgi:flagellin